MHIGPLFILSRERILRKGQMAMMVMVGNVSGGGCGREVMMVVLIDKA